VTLSFNGLLPASVLSRQRSRARAPLTPPYIPKDLRDEWRFRDAVQRSARMQEIGLKTRWARTIMFLSNGSQGRTAGLYPFLYPCSFKIGHNLGCADGIGREGEKK